MVVGFSVLAIILGMIDDGLPALLILKPSTIFRIGAGNADGAGGATGAGGGSF